MHILIVEGDPTMRDRIVGLVERLGHRTTATATARDAMLLIAQTHFDSVMCSWETPALTAPDLFRQARALGGEDFTYLLLVIDKSQVDRLETGLSAGADDYIITPIDINLLAVRLNVAERIVTLNKNLNQQNRELTSANQSLNAKHKQFTDEFQAAARIQRSLLPKTQERLGRFTLHSSLIPSSVVSGDTYNFFPIDSETLALYAVDVVGHGVQAALTSFMLTRLIDADSFTDGSANDIVQPANLVHHLNQKFRSLDETTEYFTMLCATIRENTLSFCQAGHPSPVLVRDGEKPRPLGDGGFPVGLLPDVDYATETFELSVGDRVVFCSDGVTECADPAGALYGERRLHQILERNRSEPLDQMISRLQDDLYAWRGSQSFGDDVSILALEMHQ